MPETPPRHCLYCDAELVQELRSSGPRRWQVEYQWVDTGTVAPAHCPVNPSHQHEPAEFVTAYSEREPRG